jgi:hypothetical protein
VIDDVVTKVAFGAQTSQTDPSPLGVSHAAHNIIPVVIEQGASQVLILCFMALDVIAPTGQDQIQWLQYSQSRDLSMNGPTTVAAPR